MKKKFAVCIFLSLFFSMNSFAQEFIVGAVVEYVPENKVIQICDSLYKADHIYMDDGINAISTTSFTSVKGGSVVQVFPLTKEGNYWSTDKVIILIGNKQKQMIEEYGLERTQRRKLSLK